MEVDEYVKLVFTKRNVNGQIAAFFQTEPRNHCPPNTDKSSHAFVFCLLEKTRKCPIFSVENILSIRLRHLFLVKGIFM